MATISTAIWSKLLHVYNTSTRYLKHHTALCSSITCAPLFRCSAIMLDAVPTYYVHVFAISYGCPLCVLENKYFARTHCTGMHLKYVTCFSNIHKKLFWYGWPPAELVRGKARPVTPKILFVSFFNFFQKNEFRLTNTRVFVRVGKSSRLLFMSNVRHDIIRTLVNILLNYAYIVGFFVTLKAPQTTFTKPVLIWHYRWISW